MTKHDPDFDFEPIVGLPAKLPEDEKILWSGSPQKWRFGHQMFHTRIIMAVFVILAVSSIFSGLDHGASLTRIVMTFITLLAVGGAIVGAAVLWGWLVAINTVYTLTDKRFVIRHGVTLPMAINVPFAKVANAAAKIREDASGDISFALLDGNRLALYAAWPHNRPWSWQGTAPAIRCVADAPAVARIVADALAAYASTHGQTCATARPKVPIRIRPGQVSPGHVRPGQVAAPARNAEPAGMRSARA